ncbi:MAG: FmdB family zinc ribbon protein, partial [Burkholderiales bacterium]
QRLSDATLTKCPECGKRAFKKLVTAAGFHLKGTGWYATDFKNSGAKPAANQGNPESKQDKPETKQGKSETMQDKPAAMKDKPATKQDKTADGSSKEPSKSDAARGAGACPACS